LAGANFLPAARPLVGLQNFLAQAMDFGVISTYSSSAINSMGPARDSARGAESGGSLRSAAGESACSSLLFFCHVNVHVLFARILAHDHAFIDIDRRPDEQFAAFLDVPQRKCGGWSAAVRYQRTG